VPREQAGIPLDHPTDFWTGDYEASSQDFSQVTGSEWLDIVEGLGPSETKEETASSLRARDAGASTTQNFCPHHPQRNPRSRLMVVHLDRLAPYQGATRDERP
jgi:hypothetical protein